MTTITVERSVLEQTLDLIEGEYQSLPEDKAYKVLTDLRIALAASATAPEQCWCDEQNIGEPGVSCGDCPTRDYKHPATAPAWQDAPNYAGIEEWAQEWFKTHLSGQPSPRETWQAATAAALERAAAEVEKTNRLFYFRTQQDIAQGCAKAIRALKDKP